MTGSPVPGWYPSPEGAAAERWWDGYAWTNQVRPAQPPAQPPPQAVPPQRPQGSSTTATGRPPLGQGFGGLATAVTIGLAVTGILDLANGIASAWTISVFKRWYASPASVDTDLADRIDSVTGGIALLYALCLLATAGLFLAWLYRAHRSDAVAPELLCRSSGWAIGAWIVPIVSVFWPAQIVGDVERAAHRLRGTAPPPMALRNLWWAAWLAMNILGNVYLQLERLLDSGRDEQYLPAMTSALHVDVASSVFGVVAAVLAIMLVRRITATLVSPVPAPSAWGSQWALGPR